MIGSRRRYDSAYQAAEAYFPLVVELDLPSSPQGRGGSVCAYCRAGFATIVQGRRGGRTVCTDCGKPWVALDLTAAVRAPRTSKMRKLSTKRPPRRPGDTRCMMRLDDLMPLRVVFQPRPREMTAADWSFHRLCLEAQTYKRMPIAKIVASARKHGIPSPRGWTEDTVRGALERVTVIVEDRLHRAGLWSGPPRERWSDGGGRRWRRPRSSSRATTSAIASA